METQSLQPIEINPVLMEIETDTMDRYEKPDFDEFTESSELYPETKDTFIETATVQTFENKDRAEVQPQYLHLQEQLTSLPEFEDYHLDATYEWRFDLGTERMIAGLFLGSETIIDSLMATGFYQEHFHDIVNKQAKTGIYQMDRHGHIRLTVLAKELSASPDNGKVKLFNQTKGYEHNMTKVPAKNEQVSKVIDIFGMFEQAAERQTEAQKDNSSGLSNGFFTTVNSFDEATPKETTPSAGAVLSNAYAPAYSSGWNAQGAKILIDEKHGIVLTGGSGSTNDYVN